MDRIECPLCDKQTAECQGAYWYCLSCGEYWVHIEAPDLRAQVKKLEGEREEVGIMFKTYYKGYHRLKQAIQEHIDALDNESCGDGELPQAIQSSLNNLIKLVKDE